MSELSISCEYCVGEPDLLNATVPDHISAMEWRRSWKKNASSFRRIACQHCGASFTLEDDGTAAEQGGFVSRKNVSMPKITGVSSTSGARTGGNALYIMGEALDIGSMLTVKFGGKLVTFLDERSSTQVRVIVPPATYTLNNLKLISRCETTAVLGDLQENEAVTSPAGTTGVIWLIQGSVHWIEFSYIAEADAGLVGVGLTGGTSGGVVTTTATTTPNFLPGEFALGISSAAQGIVRTASPLVVDGPSGGYAPNELVKGSASGALCKLGGGPAYSGLVDITVENEYGQRVVGGTLSGAYTYA